jgi:NAD(P)-dependent dehydrogenase (short-subunit alcohol dehydrogenase family)
VNRLDGKVAIVTGAATGLGRAIAEVYAGEGAQVVVADIRADEGNETVRRVAAAGGDAIFVPTDVGKSDDVQALVAAAESHYGKLDVMTANAGMLGRGAYKSLVDMTDEEIAEIMAVNYFGVVYSLKHAVPAIRRAGGGAMTVTSSISAHRGKADLPVYASSKGAIFALVMSLAIDLAPDIRVNAVTPGAMLTEISKHAAEAKGIDPVATQAARTKPHAATIADPAQVASVHLFLVSDEASYVNGHSLIADGGQILRTA